MSRPFTRRTLRLESLESRELLTAGGPTAEAQYMLELVNQARTNPAAMADRVTSNLDADELATLSFYKVDLAAEKAAIAGSAPRPAVGWNDTLAATAAKQSQDQADTGVQTHTGADGSSLGQRLDRAGYTNRASDGENAYAYSKSVDHATDAFLIDWGVSSKGHRNNLLQPTATADQYYREVGIGVVDSNRANFGPKVITQDFARQAGSKAELLGVAFYDPSHNHTFALNSGQGNVEIDAQNESTKVVKSTSTWDAGGYQIPLDPGTYKVTAKVNGTVVRTQEVSIGDQNVKVDYDLSDPWQKTSSSADASTSVAGKATPPSTTNGNSDSVKNPLDSWSSSWTAWTSPTK